MARSRTCRSRLAEGCGQDGLGRWPRLLLGAAILRGAGFRIAEAANFAAFTADRQPASFTAGGKTQKLEIATRSRRIGGRSSIRAR